ncbi:hypothetical protein HHX47_DHR3001224, partial [Lentinula edodes]
WLSKVLLLSIRLILFTPVRRFINRIDRPYISLTNLCIDIKPDNILIHNLDYSDEERSTKFLAVNPVETLENGSPKTQHIPHRWTYKSVCMKRS